MKLYTTSEFISSDISFEKQKNKKQNKKKNLTRKMKLYITREFISNDTSFAPKSIILLLCYLTQNNYLVV